jgi:pre-rRNA-processing protein IPI1
LTEKKFEMGKKKTTKQKDFVKKKFKVGKSKAAANNATNVSFKTQKIQVPTQTITTESETEELLQVLHSLQHHNDATKQNALQKLKAIFKANPKVLLLSIGLLCNTLARSSLDLVIQAF